MSEGARPRPKVVAATAGAGAGAAVAGFVLWALDTAFWGGDLPPDVPGPVSTLVWLVTPAGVAFVAGYVRRDRPAGDHAAR